jgi:hypothetical protein
MRGFGTVRLCNVCTYASARARDEAWHWLCNVSDMARAQKTGSKTSASSTKKAKPSRAKRKRSATKKWSQRVTQTSDAMDLEPSVFKRDARAIAASLKRSAERSRRRKSPPYRSAMSMLTFYVNRGGRNISAPQRRKLAQAKTELRRLFGKEL